MGAGATSTQLQRLSCSQNLKGKFIRGWRWVSSNAVLSKDLITSIFIILASGVSPAYGSPPKANVSVNSPPGLYNRGSLDPADLD